MKSKPLTKPYQLTKTILQKDNIEAPIYCKDIHNQMIQANDWVLMIQDHLSKPMLHVVQIHEFYLLTNTYLYDARTLCNNGSSFALCTQAKKAAKHHRHWPSEILKISINGSYTTMHNISELPLLRSSAFKNKCFKLKTAFKGNTIHNLPVILITDPQHLSHLNSL